MNKKIWPAKSVLGKRFNKTVNSFFDKFKVRKTPHQCNVL